MALENMRRYGVRFPEVYAEGCYNLDNNGIILENVERSDKGREIVKTLITRYITPDVQMELMKSFRGIEAMAKRPSFFGLENFTVEPVDNIPFQFEFSYDMSGGRFVCTELFLLGKVLPVNVFGVGRDIMKNMFRKDRDISRFILTKLEKFQESNKIPTNYPRIYYPNLSNDDDDLVIFEHLMGRALVMNNYRAPMSYKKATTAMRAYAKLHAGALLLETARGDLADLCPRLKMDVYINEQQTTFMRRFLAGKLESHCLVLEKMIELNSKYENLIVFIRKIKDIALDMFRTSFEPTAPFKTVTHGSFGVNTLHFSNDDNEVSLSGFGGSKYASHAADINNFLFICIDSLMRREKANDLIDIYYHTFKNLLKNHKHGVPFSREELQEEIKAKYLTGWFGALLSLQSYIGGIHCRTNFPLFHEYKMEDFIMEDRKVILELFARDKVFKERLVGVYDYIYDIYTCI